ncbi:MULTISPECIES: nitrate reductase subunit beta [Geobacillus]|uniref:nitrate reductase (quinone) n=1 Tax=Geobacillus thermodenitrificans (strain NG80-2) TaxID=420246 RepID=A4IP23_GEOTN|nr:MULTISPECIES: nitrate reductase subunit beta [Geobacillus]ABO67077.1 Nitrate reductase beta subunit [Geobacillus thermodenitrificans NG80-2]MEC5186773.1 nitrate reductase beta subunit [Geobacillus thermodenitrificans]MED0661858.1 nitrate reductase subunit beta [Geobacillus thermodenitrificans]OQP10950.1 nitrate reductase subunit beta [Geobacillus sp. 47C-IIb]PJW20862.1 nitrate reductase subunit beta [Geobacillus thermodenitrificans]
MKIKAQVGMVMNLDKCIGCHTCSVTCKNTWTNRPGAEYMYFNNVETKPGIGYPKQWEDQDKYKGGWELKDGELRLKSGPKAMRLVNLFYNPYQPTIDDYYEPWNYDYETLTNSPQKRYQPVARPKSAITGEWMEVSWGPNWEDDLAGAHVTGLRDPNVVKMEQAIQAEFEDVFMMYLPRICEHCLNPSCVSSCPSGAMYKRDEDGIVLVDQNACRAWRYCVTSCPYKKVYFNWQTNKAEKCTLCFPRIEAGLPTICSETCVGRIRYIGVMLYDADKVKEAASVADEKHLYHAQLDIFLDPNDPTVIAEAKKAGIPDEWIAAAQRSPIYKMIVDWKIALPLHPEYRTLPMVWYIPPLSPIMNTIEGKGSGANADDIFPAIDEMRIPIEYLANLLTAGDTAHIRTTLKKMAAMRSYMRAKQTNKQPDIRLIESLGLSHEDIEEMYRLLAIAKYEDRFVIPASHREEVADLYTEQGSCGLAFAGGPGACGTL